MGYRKCFVDGQLYNYAVGKSHVHIKSEALEKPLNFKKEQVGDFWEFRCECCGEPMSRLGYRADEIRGTFVVTPRKIREVVVEHRDRPR